jgi:hypothetical protein
MGATVGVLIPEIVPRKRRHEILDNQRGRVPAAALGTAPTWRLQRCRFASTIENLLVTVLLGPRIFGARGSATGLWR